MKEGGGCVLQPAGQRLFLGFRCVTRAEWPSLRCTVCTGTQKEENKLALNGCERGRPVYTQMQPGYQSGNSGEDQTPHRIRRVPLIRRALLHVLRFIACTTLYCMYYNGGSITESLDSDTGERAKL